MKVTVTNPAGTQLFFELEGSQTLHDLSACVEEEEGVPRDMQLFFVPEASSPSLPLNESLDVISCGSKGDLDLVLRYDMNGGGPKIETQSPQCDLKCCCLQARCINNCTECSCCCVKATCSVM